MSLSPLGGDHGAITIAAFNIQTFGKTKRSKPEVMAVLAKIAREFDVLLVRFPAWRKLHFCFVCTHPDDHFASFLGNDQMVLWIALPVVVIENRALPFEHNGDLIAVSMETG